VSEQHVPQPHPRPTAPPERPVDRQPADEPTGDATVDAALADLHAIDPDAPPAEQLPALVAVHEALQQRLSSTEA
jgi:hypothetical protein